MNFEPVPLDPWHALRRFTAARIGRGRTGGSSPTRELLAFNADHALARDAVHAPFDAEALAAELRALGAETLLLASAAPDRATYLRRPDLGRRLPETSAAQLAALTPQLAAASPSLTARPSTLNPSSAAPDLAIIVSDGLSAQAAQTQAAPLIGVLLPLLAKAAFTLAPICIVRLGRVGLLDEIGAALHATMALILLGERPGLGTPDSLGAYFEFAPQSGRTNAERNCVSNIRPAGLAPADAARRLADLLTAARTQRTSGIALKETRALA